jgi:hypothetical protein
LTPFDWFCLARAQRIDSRQHRLDRPLQRDDEFDVHARVVRVAKVIHAVDINDINVLRIKPVAGPYAGKAEPIAAILEAAIAVVALADTKRVFASEVGLVTVIGNASTTGMLFLLPRFCLRSAFVLLPRAFFFGLRVLVALGRSLFFLLCRFLRLRFFLVFFLVLVSRLIFIFLLLVALLLLWVSKSGGA